ncbi:glycosyltransferase [Enterococcus casseliflavus]|uniref:glycosyltransferase n=1 Tax=Enterococcus casseliflavus TaxID=37734 RepID=UPI0039901FFA
MECRFGIVILNYLNYEDTIECVHSILNDKYGKVIPIVLVDNHSNNNSFEILNEKFKKISNIHILKSNKNLGFAKGNNIGITYLRRNFSIDNVLLLNNDTVINDSAYLEYFYNNNYSKKIGAIGSKIIGKDNLNQNPISKKVSLRNAIKYLIWLNLNQNILYKKHNNRNKMQNPQINNLSDGFYLHGSAIMLTKPYLEIFGGFYNGTFLYYEENILSYLINKSDLSFDYVSKVSIYHKEDMSSSLSFSNNNKVKKKFVEKSILKFLLLHLIPMKLISYLNKKNINNLYDEIFD